ncbi:hypothetical protein MWU61_05190 [Loktanella sp. F6476L]|uniref:hypothetical protein n=1 Tax=Loktanella sp. F6476L TaxID=2926405 RepID=UPI001FF69833|nr:hypothetical protein [Loktanella sp. F6476L]MCK0119921.1 hypothetical protein [Loktanella sp. F6476L]UWQ97972.1 hypothetical protein K3729_10855 [Rhodobacteraceae bacterium S2214]
MSAQQLPRKKFLENLRDRVIGEDRAVTLVVGDVVKWTTEGRTMPYVEDLTYVDFDQLSEDTIATIRPDVVLSPLVTDGFDAYQVTRFLASAAYKGRYRAISQTLPNLTMIRNEIRAVGPAIDFDIVIMPPTLVSVN